MPRPPFFVSTTHPYHVTCRCNNKEFFPIPISEVWTIMLNELHKEVRERSLAVHAFVLMGNHFHLLCHTPDGNLDQIMHRFLKTTSIKIHIRNRSINHLWGGRYKWSLIENQTHYYQVYRYIYQNPLRAKICSRVQDYPYSTLHETKIPLHSYVPWSFGGEEGELAWLNEKYRGDDEELIKLGLKKSFFDVSKRKLNALNRLSVPGKS
jgi:putative transposase